MFSFTKNLNLQLIVVDNASSETEREKLKEYYKDFDLILSDENLGTSKAFNKALNRAKGKYVLWLNPDVVFIEDFIGKLFSFMETNPKCGVCCGNLICADKTPSESYRRTMLSYKTIKQGYSLTYSLFSKLFKKSLSEKYNFSGKPMEVGCVIGADMFVRREIFDVIGGFDEDIFMYAEETEFQFRIKKFTEYEIYSVPDAKLIHLEGQSFSGKTFSERRHALLLNGTSVFMEKSYGKKQAVKYFDLVIKSYKKFIAVFWLFKGKRQVFKKKLEIAKDLRNKYLEKNGL